MTQTASIIRVAAYLRAATLPLAAEQAALLHSVADMMPSWRIVAVFCDISNGPARPARDGAIAAAPSGGFEVLLITGLDRLTRRDRELHGLIGRLTAASVTVCSLDRWPTAPTRHDDPTVHPRNRVHAEQAIQRLRALTAGQSAIPALAIGPAPADEER